VKPDEYFRMMYPYIGQAKQPAEYLDDLLCNFVVDDADFTGSPLTDKTPDYKNRIYNGSKPFPISLAAQLLDSSDPMCFSAYINDNLSDDLAENLEKELTELGIDIQGDDVADKCAKLFVSILTETARRTKRKDTPARAASLGKQKLTGVPIATVYVKDGKISINGQVFNLHEKITPPKDIAQEEMPYIKALFAAYAQYFINSREMGQLIIVENERTLPNLDYNQSGVKQIIFTGVIGEEHCGFLHDCKFDIPQSPKE